MTTGKKPEKDEEGKKEFTASGWGMPKKEGQTAKTKATHTVKSGETLSDIALKYYGSAVKEKWMAIYEANKDVIGDDPNLIKEGQKLRIPEIS